MDQILAPVSAGELLDKITILRIRREQETDPNKLLNVTSELDALEETWARAGGPEAGVQELAEQLAEINRALWDIEDRIRDKEASQTFDDEFIELARSVYRNNDRRAALKKEISLRCGSAIVEEKSYKDY